MDLSDIDTSLRNRQIAETFDSRFYQENLGSEVIFNGQRVIMLGSVNYLGLSHHPSVMRATIKAVERFGSGGIGSRASNGCLMLHRELDDSLAEFMGKEKAITFNSGYLTNLGVLSSAFGKNAVLFSDKENHLSIYDACRLSGLRYYRYRHNDMNHLESLLKQHRLEDEKWIIVVSTFGVTGEAVKLLEVVSLARKYGAKIYLDDAHLIGIFGKRKRGLAEECEVMDEIDLIMGSFQMAFGNIGGFVVGKRSLIDQIRFHSRPYIFSHTLPASNVAAILESLRIIASREGDELVKNLWKNVNAFRKGLSEIGLTPISKDTHLTSVFIGPDEYAINFNSHLLRNGVWAQIYLHPSVPINKAIIRFTCMATHTEQQINKAVKIIKEISQGF